VINNCPGRKNENQRPDANRDRCSQVANQLPQQEERRNHNGRLLWRRPPLFLDEPRIILTPAAWIPEDSVRFVDAFHDLIRSKFARQVGMMFPAQRPVRCLDDDIRCFAQHLELVVIAVYMWHSYC
jgi:hypothetical protein